jgi:hypothetical protein
MGTRYSRLAATQSSSIVIAKRPTAAIIRIGAYQRRTGKCRQDRFLLIRSKLIQSINGKAAGSNHD